MSSSTNHKWLLRERHDDYRTFRVSHPVEYFAGVRREWAFRREESESHIHDLIAMSAELEESDQKDGPEIDEAKSTVADLEKVVETTET
ncbi:hypothetical protein AgCh_032331 [Apium graveolens]